MKSSAALLPPRPRLRLLGGFELLDAHGNPVALPYDKARAMLALLVLERGGQSREALAGLLWPQSGAEQARTNLRRALFDLRRVLRLLHPGGDADALLLADKKQLRLGPGLDWSVDVWQLDADEAAGAAPGEARLALYRGPLLAGLEVADAPAFEDWLRRQRERLRQVVLDGHQQLFRERLSLDDPGGARLQLLRCLELEPWSEALQRELLVLLARDSVPAALAHFEQFRAALWRELGAVPQAATLELVASLQREAPAGLDVVPSQRRSVVVLACDLEAPGDDAEDFSAWLHEEMGALQQLLRSRQGHVQRADGAELLAFFGHPEASEHAPRRALDAALQILAHSRARCRIALDLGWVLAGRSPAAVDLTGALGKKARQLAQQARPGEAWCGVALLPLAQRSHALGPVEARGARLLPGPPRRERRLPMFGRGAELERLLGHWARAEQGSPRLLWVSGGPGLGKTRLLRALADRAAAGGAAVLQLRCLPETRFLPYAPAIALLRRVLEARGLDLGSVAALAQALAPLGPADAAVRHALAELLLPGSGATPPQAEEPAAPSMRADALRQRRLVEQGLQEMLERRARRGALLLLFEDLHWCDAATLEFLSRQLKLQGSGWMLVCSAREPAPAALQPRLVEQLALAPLDDAALRELLCVSAALDEAGQRWVLRHAEGVPLFAQELARVAPGRGDDTVPATLWGLLAERVEALGMGVRRVLDMAAVLGQSFDGALLARCLPEQGPLEPQLALLQQAGLLRVGGDGRYRFDHALLREVAYQRQTRQQRRHLHRRVADLLLERRGQGAPGDEPALLAQHLQAAGDAAAAHYWLEAGRRADARSALSEARHAYEQGLASLALAPLPRADRLALALHQALGLVLLALGGYGSAAAREHLGQALLLSRRLADGPAELQALHGLWLGGRSVAGDDTAMDSARRLASAAERAGDEAARLQACYALGNNLFFLGELAQAEAMLRRARALQPGVPDVRLLQRFGEHGGIAAQAMLGLVLGLQGQAAAGLAAAELALGEAAVLGHAQTLGLALSLQGLLLRHLQLPLAAQACGDQLLRLADDHQQDLWRAVGWLLTGWACCRQGDVAGLGPLGQAMAVVREVMPAAQASFLSFELDGRLALGQGAAVLRLSGRALRLAAAHQEHYLLPELWRLRAEALGLCGAPRPALCHALRRAQAHGAGSALARLRIAASRLRLLREHPLAEGAFLTLRELLPRVFPQGPGGRPAPSEPGSAQVFYAELAAAPRARAPRRGGP